VTPPPSRLNAINFWERSRNLASKTPRCYFIRTFPNFLLAKQVEGVSELVRLTWTTWKKALGIQCLQFHKQTSTIRWKTCRMSASQRKPFPAHSLNIVNKANPRSPHFRSTNPSINRLTLSDIQKIHTRKNPSLFPVRPFSSAVEVCMFQSLLPPKKNVLR